MDDLSATKQIWHNLYQAAIDFRDLGSWEWMSDEEIFGVQHPVTGEIGYCCIMGALGEMFALAVYLGSEGLQTYLAILSGGDNLFDELFSSQKCLMASFEPRQNLTKQDRQQIKELGFKFRGGSAWPLFRNYQPGYAPWYLTLEEAEFLTLALQQSKELAIRLYHNEKSLQPPQTGHYLVRIPDGEGEALTWKDAWVSPEPWKPPFLIPQPNQEALRALADKIVRTGDTWEMDFFHAPMPIQENRNQRPYFPWVLLAADQFSGLVLICHLASEENYKTEFQEAVIRLLRERNIMPKNILVGRPELYKLLDPLKSGLNLKMRIANKLKGLERVKESLFDFCRRPPGDLEDI